MALIVSPSGAVFFGNARVPQVLSLSNGVRPYSGSLAQAGIASATIAYLSPNKYLNSDNLLSSIATNGTVAGGIFTSSSTSGTLALTEAVTPGTPYTFSGAANATGLLPGIAGATWNPSDKASGITLSNSNLTATNATASTWESVRAQGGVSSGKWYWENTIGADSSGHTFVAIAKAAAGLTANPGADLNIWSYYGYAGTKYNGGGGAGIAYGATFTTGDIIGVALDLSAGTVTFYKNGTSQGVAFTGLSGTFYPMVSVYDLSNAVTTNFGTTAFAYAPPSGFSGYSSIPLLTVRDVAGNLIKSATVSGTGRFACAPWTPPTNLMPFSDAMAGSAWNKGGAVYGTSGPNGATSINYTIPATQGDWYAQTAPASVTAGQKATFSVWCNPSICTSGGLWLLAYDYTSGSIGAALGTSQPTGPNGRYGYTVTVPSGCTKIVWLLRQNPGVGIIAPGKVVIYSEPMVEIANAASGYYISSQAPQAVFSYEQNGVSGTGYFDQPMLRTDGVSTPWANDNIATVTVTPLNTFGNTVMTLTDSTSGTPLSILIPVASTPDLEGISIFVYDTSGNLVYMPTGFISGEFHDSVNGGSGSSTLTVPRAFMDSFVNYDYRVQMFLPDSVDPWYDGYVADFVPMSNDMQDSEQVILRLEGWQTFMGRDIVSEDLTPSASAGTMNADTYLAHLLGTYLDSSHFGTCYIASAPYELNAMTEDGAGLNQCIDDVVAQIVDNTGNNFEWWVRSVKGQLPAVVIQPSQNPNLVTTGRIAPTTGLVPVTFLYDFRDSTTFTDQLENTGRNIYNMIALYGGQDPTTQNQQVYGAFKDSTSISLYGLRQKKVTNTNLLSAATLSNYATAYLLLNAYPLPQRTYQRFIATDALRGGKWVQVFDNANGTQAQAIHQMRTVEAVVKIDQTSGRITQQAALTAPLPYSDSGYYSAINQAANGAASSLGRPPSASTQNFCVLNGFDWVSSFVSGGQLNVRITPPSGFFLNSALAITLPPGSDSGNYDVALKDAVSGATGDGYYEVVFAYDPLTTYGVGSHSPGLVCIQGRTPYDTSVLRGWGFTVVGNAVVGDRDLRVFGGVTNANIPASAYSAPTLSSSATVSSLVTATPGLSSGFTVTAPLNNVPQDGNCAGVAWFYKVNGTSTWSGWDAVPVAGRPAPPASQTIAFTFPDLPNGGLYDIGIAYVGVGGEHGTIALIATAVATSSVSVGGPALASIPSGFAATGAITITGYSTAASGASAVANLTASWTVTNYGTGSPSVASWLDHVDVYIAPHGTTAFALATTIQANALASANVSVAVGFGQTYDVIMVIVAANAASTYTTGVLATTVMQQLGGGGISDLGSANLIVDSALAVAAFNTSGMAATAPNFNLYNFDGVHAFVGRGGADGDNYFGFDPSAGAAWAQSDVITVVPGQWYYFAGYCDASPVYPGTYLPGFFIQDTARTTTYASVTQAMGDHGQIFGWWQCPGGVTQVVMVADKNGATITGSIVVLNRMQFNAVSGTGVSVPYQDGPNVAAAPATTPPPGGGSGGGAGNPTPGPVGGGGLPRMNTQALPVQQTINENATLNTSVFPGGQLTQQGALTNIDGVSSTVLSLLPTGSTAKVSGKIAKGGTAFSGFIIGNITNGYGVDYDGSGSFYIFKCVSGVFSAIGAIQYVGNDTNQHTLTLGVRVDGAHNNVLSISWDGIDPNAGQGVVDTALDLTTGTWPVTVYTGGSAGTMTAYTGLEVTFPQQQLLPGPTRKTILSTQDVQGSYVAPGVVNRFSATPESSNAKQLSSSNLLINPGIVGGDTTGWTSASSGGYSPDSDTFMGGRLSIGSGGGIGAGYWYQNVSTSVAPAGVPYTFSCMGEVDGPSVMPSGLIVQVYLVCIGHTSGHVFGSYSISDGITLPANNGLIPMSFTFTDTIGTDSSYDFYITFNGITGDGGITSVYAYQFQLNAGTTAASYVDHRITTLANKTHAPNADSDGFYLKHSQITGNHLVTGTSGSQVNVDTFPDGTTHGKVVLGALTSGNIDTTKAGVLGAIPAKNLVVNGNNANGTGSVVPSSLGWTQTLGSPISLTSVTPAFGPSGVYPAMWLQSNPNGAYWQDVPCTGGQIYTFCVALYDGHVGSVYANPGLWIGSADGAYTQYNGSPGTPVGTLGEFYTSNGYASGIGWYLPSIATTWAIRYGTFTVPTGVSKMRVMLYNSNNGGAAVSGYYAGAMVVPGNRLQDYIDNEGQAGSIDLSYHTNATTLPYAKHAGAITGAITSGGVVQNVNGVASTLVAGSAGFVDTSGNVRTSDAFFANTANMLGNVLSDVVMQWHTTTSAVSVWFTRADGGNPTWKLPNSGPLYQPAGGSIGSPIASQSGLTVNTNVWCVAWWFPAGGLPNGTWYATLYVGTPPTYAQMSAAFSDGDFLAAYGANSTAAAIVVNGGSGSGQGGGGRPVNN